MPSRRDVDRTFAARIPGVAAFAAGFGRVARYRVRGFPVGLVLLFPLAVAIDLFDIGDELVGGPIGMGLSFLIETAFLLGLTGRASYALAFAGIDLIPFVDTIPFATMTLLRELFRSPQAETAAPPPPEGPIIDV